MRGTCRSAVHALVSLALLSLASCTSEARPPLPPAPAPDVASPYRIRVGDALAIRFARNPELNEDVAVRPDGMVSLQLIEPVAAAGRTPGELDVELRRLYTPQLAHPDVRVIVKSFSDQRVAVSGEVAQPGVQQLVSAMTMSEAIARAGGLLPSANRRQVVLIRRHEDGRVTGYAVDMRGVENGASPGDDVALQPLDEVVVLRSRIANVNQFVELYIRKNIPVNSLGLGITPF